MVEVLVDVLADEECGGGELGLGVELQGGTGVDEGYLLPAWVSHIVQVEQVELGVVVELAVPEDAELDEVVVGLVRHAGEREGVAEARPLVDLEGLQFVPDELLLAGRELGVQEVGGAALRERNGSRLVLRDVRGAQGQVRVAHPHRWQDARAIRQDRVGVARVLQRQRHFRRRSEQKSTHDLHVVHLAQLDRRHHHDPQEEHQRHAPRELRPVDVVPPQQQRVRNTEHVQLPDRLRYKSDQSHTS